MLQYFSKTSPKYWTISGALQTVERSHPAKNRAFHLHLIKEDLKLLLNHQNESHRTTAETIINNWDALKPKETGSQQQVAQNITNNAHNQTNYQSTNQSFYASTIPEEIQVSPIHPDKILARKRSWSKMSTSSVSEEGTSLQQHHQLEHHHQQQQEQTADETLTFDINIWDYWIEVIERMKSNSDVHEHSLEHLHIIQLGNKIRSRTTQRHYDEDIINATTHIIVKDVPDQFSDENQYHDAFFDILTLSNQEAKSYLVEKKLFVYNSKNPFLIFSEAVYETFVQEVFIHDTDVYEDEVNLNHRLIFPILQSLARSSQGLRFLPGETRLKAVAYELELLLHETSHHYNADATFTCNSHQLEMALLETTGKLHVEDKPKETKDYVKAGYGVLSMLHRIGRIYKYADFELFKKLGVYFIQVTPFKIRIWKFNMPDHKIYCLNCIASVKIPTDRITCEMDLRNLINVMWFLKTNMDNSMKILDDLKISHANKMKLKSRRLPGHENIIDIDSHFKTSTTMRSF
ncbi:unnamed protein product [Rhizopus stolonifer]